MIKVECIACKGPYELDEKRLPPSGLKMRCPKCGAVFLVFPDGRVTEAPQKKQTMLGAAVPPPPASGGAPPVPPGDLPAVKKPALPVPPPRPVAVAPPSSAMSLDDELDLPAPARPGGGGLGDLDVDLPAPRGAKPAVPAPPAFDVDLPAPRGAKPMAPGPATAALFDEDLPAPRGAPKPPPPKVEAPRASPRLDDDDLPAPRAAGRGNAMDIDLPAPRAATKAGAGETDLPRPATPKNALAQGLAAAAAAARPKPGPKESVKPALADGGRNPFDDLEGDSLAGAKKPSFPGVLGDDLPAPRKPGTTPGVTDLPAAKAKAGFDLDLPAPKSKGVGGGLDLDLPAPKGKGGGLELDLPTPKGKGGGLELDLPTPKGRGAPASLDLDLPTPKHGGIDLPAPKSSGLELDLPTPKRDLDLPAAKGRGVLAAADQAFGDLDLPVPRKTGPGVVDLPATVGGAELPMLAPDGGQRVDLPAARGIADLPVPRGGGFSEPPASSTSGSGLELPLPSLRAPAPPAPARGALGGDLDLPPPRVPTSAGVPARGHGEVDLPGTDGGGGDAMEFDGIPQTESLPAPPIAPAVPASGIAAVEAPARIGRVAPKAPDGAKPRRSRAVPIAIVLIAGIVAAGGALSATPYGPFGYYAIEQHLPAAGDPATVERVIGEADTAMLRDTFGDGNAALEDLSDARGNAGLSRRLLARSLVHEAHFAVRFGDTSGAARAAAIRQRIEERGVDDPVVALAIAADELRQGRGSGISGRIATARAAAPTDPFVDIIEAEAALAADDAGAANQSFRQALEHGGGAAAQWGVARALILGDALPEDLVPEIDATLALSPGHGDAMVERARIHIGANEDELALHLLRRVVGAEPMDDGTSIVSPPALRGAAWALLGELHESRGRLAQAEEAYDEAIGADGTRVDALLGSGRVLLVDRPTDALTRFESVIERADAESITTATGRTASADARLGAARAMLDLGRELEGKETLTNLATEREGDAEVLRWLGRAEELLDDHEAAEQHMREAILADPSSFDGYLFLARMYGDLHRDSDAVAVLDSARAAVPEGAAMRESLGIYELGLNRLDQAVTELTRALEIDPLLPGARFSLGVAHRRAGRFTEAEEAFDRLAVLDPGHPGLALERGLLFEARGESDRAVEFYAEALLASPDDPELLLRLGAAQVGAGLLDEATATLEHVQRELPASAEAEHFVGRIALARGDYPGALEHLDRAIELDATRAEFYVYAGLAALENDSLGRARERAEAAIARDPSLGDAFWIRGTVRLRLRAVRDAIADLEHALVLRPSRTEALAAMGECYEELRELAPAIDAYTRAVAASELHGEWWYRLGRLQLDADRARDAAHSLSRAALLGDAAAPQPLWLADAHRLLGDASRLTGDRTEAVVHYQRYLDLAEDGAIDRGDVRRALMDLGVVPHD